MDEDVRKQPNIQELESKIRTLEAELANVTQQKQQIENQTYVYRNLFSNAPFEIHIWQIIRDNAGRIHNWRLIDANPKALGQWAMLLDDIKGKTTDQIFPSANPIDTFMPVVEKIFSTNKTLSWEEYFSATDQTLRMTSIPSGDCFISARVDASDLKRIENELRIKNKRCSKC
jgi:hypothetical protein